MHDITERYERIATGTLKFVVTDEEVIYKTFKQLLEEQDKCDKMSKTSNPYSNDFASKGIADILKS